MSAVWVVRARLAAGAMLFLPQGLAQPVAVGAGSVEGVIDPKVRRERRAMMLQPKALPRRAVHA